MYIVSRHQVVGSITNHHLIYIVKLTILAPNNHPRNVVYPEAQQYSLMFTIALLYRIIACYFILNIVNCLTPLFAGDTSLKNAANVESVNVGALLQWKKGG